MAASWAGRCTEEAGRPSEGPAYREASQRPVLLVHITGTFVNTGCCASPSVGALMTLKLRSSCSTALIGLFFLPFFPSWWLMNEIEKVGAVSLCGRICCAVTCPA